MDFLRRVLSVVAIPALLAIAAAGCSTASSPNPGDGDGGGDDDDSQGDAHPPGGDGGGSADASHPGDPDASEPGDPDAGQSGPDAGSTCTTGLGAWTGHDDVPASFTPPCGLTVQEAPLFVGIGFDDNGDAAGMNWALDMLAARSSKATFFMTSVYGANAAVLATWNDAYAAGHEIGNHTVNHLDGLTFSASQWQTEISGCTSFLTTGSPPVVPASELWGFRTPYLHYNDALLGALDADGFRYDASIEEGYEDNQNGTNYYWPYTLDHLSPGHTVQVSWGEGLVEIEPHPGLWELPVYAVFVPPDNMCAQYGVPVGMRAKMHTIQDWFDVDAGSITGFDYNLWASRADGGFEMSKAEFLATLKYTFDQRLLGNRAPFLFGAHTAYYVDSWNPNAPGATTATVRRQAIEQFLDYVKTKPQVRVITHGELLDWLRNPTPL